MEKTIALVGNPNVGKSTIFNRLTGLKQHTGNWAGKTVSTAVGQCRGKYEYRIYDLPGAYSLSPRSAEEQVTADFIKEKRAEAVVLVCDAGALPRNMTLLFQLMGECEKLLVVVNMMDEAGRRGIKTDTEAMADRLSVPVIGISAREKESRQRIIEALDALMDAPKRRPGPSMSPEEINRAGEELCSLVYAAGEKSFLADRRLDRILTGRVFAFPIMLLLLLGLFFISIKAANYPSAWLMEKLMQAEGPLLDFCVSIGLPERLSLMLTAGAYRTLAWVVAVMLPPMAVFFPLFTLLEDSGYLPRMAYNLDSPLKKCGGCGRQALCMCMGIGCNAAAVVGCRIIDSRRERLCAMLTNAFIPCNGRLPALIALITVFAAAGKGAFVSAAILTGALLFGAGLSMGMTKLLSLSLFKGEKSVFVLELPPYRMPRVGQVLLRSVLDRTLKVLSRAMLTAAPAGALIWLLANPAGGGPGLLVKFIAFLEGPGRLMGLDGVILAGFILGLPANEIVLPIIFMIYSGTGGLAELGGLSQMGGLLRDKGWTVETAVCVMLLFLCHPCATTLLTVYKESGSFKMLLLSLLLPACTALLLCMTAAALL